MAGFFDTLLGNSAADASNRAAQDQYAKQQGAVKGLTSFADTLPGQYKVLGEGFTPYAQAGGSALSQLMAGLGLGGEGSQDQFTQAYRNLPGYRAGLESGTDAVTRGANTGNMLNSGRTLKSLQRFGSDYEDQRIGDYFSRLTGIAGMGEQATGQQANLGAAGLGAQSNLRQSAFGGDMNAAGTIGEGMVAGANAKQSALSNLLSAGTYLGGAFLGGKFGGAPQGNTANKSISPLGAGIGPFRF